MKIISIGFLVYALFVFVLFIMQRSMIYMPDRIKPDAPEGVEVVRVKTTDGLNIEGWYYPPRSQGNKTIVFFHGNAGHYGYRAFKANIYNNAGYGVLLAGYRGYGGNPGSYGEEGFYKDGRAYISWLGQEKNVSAEQLVIYGESIGSGVAVQMATEFECAALVLEAPFSSLLAVVKKLYFFVPVDYLLKDRFMNIEKIERINAPLLIMHGTKDDVVPFDSGQALFEAASEPKELFAIVGGLHNNLYAVGAPGKVLDFLSGLSADNR